MPEIAENLRFFVFLLALVLQVSAARAVPLSDLFVAKGSGKKKQTERLDRLPLPPEYGPYLEAKRILAGSPGLETVERVQRELLLAPRAAEARTLLKEIEDQFHALEIRRGILLSKKGRRNEALSSFHRALNGLSTFKWVLYWNLEASRALAHLSFQGKKQPVRNEAAYVLARRLLETFPKAANETKPLRELPSIEAPPQAEVAAERLSQTYSEKYEKDEDALLEVLDDFLAGRDHDLIRSAQKFIADYPRSFHRFRAQFMMAEVHERNRRHKEAVPLYQAIIDQIPLSYYAILSSERLGVSLRDRVATTPLDIDLGFLNAGVYEKLTIDRAKALFGRKLYDEAGLELDSLTRTRNYTPQLLLYLMKFASLADQNLTAFKMGNEFMQRRFEGYLNSEMIDLVFPDRFQKEIHAEAARNKTDPILITSLIKQESGFKPIAISSSGALGLMQLMPFTAIDVKKDLALSTLRDPSVNIAVGTRYLQSLLDKYGGNVPFALAAYNAGPHRVMKWRKEIRPDWTMIQFIESIPYRETREYVSSILRNRYWYRIRQGIAEGRLLDALGTP